ncbi:MAG: DUF4331 domain-containing protein [Solirubrobacteraceae bacterium]
MRRVFAVSAGLSGAVAATALVAVLSTGSSHREAPGSTKDPQADWTDVYAFTAKATPKAVTIIANLDPFQLPQGGPNYNTTLDPRARYYINVDNTGDGDADIRYRFRFRDKFRGTANQGYPQALPTVDSVNDPDLNVVQKYTITEERYRSGKRTSARKVVKTGIVAPGNVGPKTMPNYGKVVASAIGSVESGGKVFVGARDDPFFIDLGGTFDSINLCRGTGNEGGCRDDVAGFNVNSIVLELPEERVTRDGKSVSGPTDPHAAVGVWASTERQRLQVSNETRKTRRSEVERSSGDDFVQVNRLGNPLVNELVVPLTVKDQFNRTEPKDDSQYAAAVLKPFPAAALNQLFKLGIKETDRKDIVTALLTGVPGATEIGSKPKPADTLKINLGVPPAQSENRFGFIGGDMAGFPNGRRLGDDVVDITLRVVGGYLLPANQGGKKLPLGDGVDRNDRAFLPAFPYVATPQSGRDVQFTRREPVHAPTPGENPR